jgi:hypothetical protein
MMNKSFLPLVAGLLLSSAVIAQGNNVKDKTTVLKTGTSWTKMQMVSPALASIKLTVL